MVEEEVRRAEREGNRKEGLRIEYELMHLKIKQVDDTFDITTAWDTCDIDE